MVHTCYTQSAPLDFSALRNEEVIFAPSETMKTVTVPIQRDNVFEGEESFTASLSLVSGSTGVEIGQQDTAAISIMDGKPKCLSTLTKAGFITISRKSSHGVRDTKSELVGRNSFV